MAQLTYKIAKLWGKSPGASEKYDLNEKLEFPGEKDLNFEGKFTGKLTFIRLKDEISALLNNCKIETKFVCTRCLKDFTEPVEIPEAEREFFLEPPELKSDDLDDLLYINRKPMTIDLGEMVRQEIILHFPLIPVCSSSCKGLCPVCGRDRNKVKCKCKILTLEEAENNRPFKDLKKII